MRIEGSRQPIPFFCSSSMLFSSVIRGSRIHFAFVGVLVNLLLLILWWATEPQQIIGSELAEAGDVLHSEAVILSRMQMIGASVRKLCASFRPVLRSRELQHYVTLEQTQRLYRAD